VTSRDPLQGRASAIASSVSKTREGEWYLCRAKTRLPAGGKAVHDSAFEPRAAVWREAVARARTVGRRVDFVPDRRGQERRATDRRAFQPA